MERTPEGKDYLKWCKERALECVERGNLPEAWTSMLSDLTNNHEFANHPAIQLGNMLFIGGNLNTKESMRKFIEDFN